MFGIHGVAGLLGAVLTGVFAVREIGNVPRAIEWNLVQVCIQFEGVLAVTAWSPVGTLLILNAIKLFASLSVSVDDESERLDYSQHGETVCTDS